MIDMTVIVVAGLIGVAAMKSEKKTGMTPERKIVLEQALRELKDPVGLRKLADSFRVQGLTAEADLLEKRAKLRELPQHVKDARRAVFRKAMTAKNPEAVETVANAFMAEGATNAAYKLFEYAKGLRMQPKPDDASPFDDVEDEAAAAQVEPEADAKTEATPEEQPPAEPKEEETPEVTNGIAAHA